MVDVADVRVKLTANTTGVEKGFADTISQLKRMEAQAYQTQKALTNAMGKSAGTIIASSKQMAAQSLVSHNQIQNHSKKTINGLKSLQLQFNQIYRTLFNIKTVALVTFGGMVKGISGAVAEAERMRASLQVITEGKGDLAFNALSSFAARTNLTTAEAVKQYTQLRAVGLQPTIEDMETLLDLTNAFGGSPAVFQRITKALGDIQAKGKLMGEEVRQLTNIGIPIRQILLESGLLAQNMVDQIGKANISASKTINAVLEYTRKNFKGITNEIMETWAGTVERMKDTWWRWSRVVGESGLIDSLKEASETMMNPGDGWTVVLQQLGFLLGEIVSATKTLLETLGGPDNTFTRIALGMGQMFSLGFTYLWNELEKISHFFANMILKALKGVTETGKAIFTRKTFDEANADTKAYGDALDKASEAKFLEMDKELAQKIIDINASLTPTDKSNSILGISREQEALLSAISKGLTSNPTTVYDEVTKQIDAAVQDGIPKSEKLRTSLLEFKDAYESLYVKGGTRDNIIEAFNTAIENAPNETAKKGLMGDLASWTKQDNANRANYVTAVKAKQLEIDKQIAREERGRLKTADQIDAKYNELVDPINKLKSGSQRWAEHQKVVLERLKQTSDVGDKFFNEYNEKLDLIINKTNQSWLQGMSDGFAEMGVQMQESYTLWKSFASNITGALTDAFTEFFDKGKTDWGNFLQIVRQMIIKTLVQQAIVGPLAESMSSVLGSFVKTGFASYFGASGSPTAYDMGDKDILGNKAPVTIEPFHPSSINASGGMLTEPVYGYGMRTGDSYLMGEAGNEAIVPLNKMGSGGSGGSNTTVNIYGGDENTRVQQKQGRNGPEIDIILDQKIAQLASKNGSAFAKSLRATYGISQRRA